MTELYLIAWLIVYPAILCILLFAYRLAYKYRRERRRARDRAAALDRIREQERIMRERWNLPKYQRGEKMKHYQMYEIEAYFGDYFEDYQQQAQAMMDTYDWDTIVHYMDDEIREDIHIALAPCTDEHFLLAYMMDHTAKYGEEFIIN